ncbi:hypothetical protein ACI79D_21905 [Geodermatophilus sp. SYSU D00708]
MALKRPLILAAAATTLGIGGVLLPGATAMAATPAQSAAVEAPASQVTTTETPTTQPDDYYCDWVYVWDDWGNWVYYEECY